MAPTDWTVSDDPDPDYPIAVSVGGTRYCVSIAQADALARRLAARAKRHRAIAIGARDPDPTLAGGEPEQPEPSPPITVRWRRNGPEAAKAIRDGQECLVAIEIDGETKLGVIAKGHPIKVHGLRSGKPAFCDWDAVTWYCPASELAPAFPRLPKTPDELRRAEAALAANPVPLPESLRDPERVLYGGRKEDGDGDARIKG
jgi:hypothetical protein